MNGYPPTDIPPHVLDQAIAWAVRLGSGSADAEQKRAFDAWREADDTHMQAWKAMEAAELPFRKLQGLPGRMAYRTLEENRQPQDKSRRRILTALGLGAVGSLSGLLAYGMRPSSKEFIATVPGERRSVVLADDTHILLNTATRLEVAYSWSRRLITLHQGEVHIETGRDGGFPLGRRPFFVRTAQANLEAIGTSFSVLASSASTRLHVTEGAVAIHVDGLQSRLVRMGQAASVDAAGIRAQRPGADGLDPSAWVEGVLVAKSMRLGALTRELSRYQSAPLHCEEDAAGLQVSGVFQLEGPDPVGRILTALGATLPILVTRAPDGAALIARR